MHDAPLISPEHKDSSREVIAALPKVDLHVHLPAGGEEITSPTDLGRAVRETIAALAADNVVYAELRLSPEIYPFGIADAVDAAVGALQHDTVDARLVLSAIRNLGRVDEVAQVAVERCGQPGHDVVGFDLSGDETAASPAEYAEVFALLRENLVPTTVHAGARGEFAAIAEAVQLNATRLGHGTQIVEDFSAGIDGIEPGRVSAWVRDRHIPIEAVPALEQEMGVVADLADHPLPLLQQLGFTCTVSAGRYTETTLTDQFVALGETFGYGVEEFFDLTVNAVNNSFSTQEERQELLETIILPAYEELADADVAGSILGAGGGPDHDSTIAKDPHA